ncbi:MAG TPA: hypothetical protein VEC60_14205 [Reyranella sp.]|nr:hypothetical protein [Reyranella sp.]
MTQLDRIENRMEGMDARMRRIEVSLAQMKGEKRGEGKAALVIKHAVTAAIGAVAGLFGGNVNIPGAH